MIRIIGSSRNEFFSNAIKKVTKEDISHVAIQYNDIIIHANRHGVVTEPLKEFLKHNTIVYSLRSCRLIHEKRLFSYIRKRLPSLLGRKYDQFYLAFFALRMLLRIWFKIPLPKDNLWNISNMYICTELVAEAIGFEMKEMLTPKKLLDELVATGLWQYKS